MECKNCKYWDEENKTKKIYLSKVEYFAECLNDKFYNFIDVQTNSYGWIEEIVIREDFYCKNFEEIEK